MTTDLPALAQGVERAHQKLRAVSELFNEGDIHIIRATRLYRLALSEYQSAQRNMNGCRAYHLLKGQRQ